MTSECRSPMRTTSTTRSAAGPAGSAVPACLSGRRPTRGQIARQAENVFDRKTLDQVRRDFEHLQSSRVADSGIDPGSSAGSLSRGLDRFDRDGGRVEMVDGDTKTDANVDLEPGAGVTVPSNGRTIASYDGRGRLAAVVTVRDTPDHIEIRDLRVGSDTPGAVEAGVRELVRAPRPAPGRPGAREPARRCARGPRPSPCASTATPARRSSSRAKRSPTSRTTCPTVNGRRCTWWRTTADSGGTRPPDPRTRTRVRPTRVRRTRTRQIRTRRTRVRRTRTRRIRTRPTRVRRTRGCRTSAGGCWGRTTTAGSASRTIRTVRPRARPAAIPVPGAAPTAVRPASSTPRSGGPGQEGLMESLRSDRQRVGAPGNTAGRPAPCCGRRRSRRRGTAAVIEAVGDDPPGTVNDWSGRARRRARTADRARTACGERFRVFVDIMEGRDPRLAAGDAFGTGEARAEMWEWLGGRPGRSGRTIRRGSAESTPPTASTTSIGRWTGRPPGTVVYLGVDWPSGGGAAFGGFVDSRTAPVVGLRHGLGPERTGDRAWPPRHPRAFDRMRWLFVSAAQRLWPGAADSIPGQDGSRLGELRHGGPFGRPGRAE